MTDEAAAWMAQVREWAASFPQRDHIVNCDRGRDNDRDYDQEDDDGADE